MKRILLAFTLIVALLSWSSAAVGSESDFDDDHDSESEDHESEETEHESDDNDEDYECDEDDWDPLEVQYVELSSQTVAFRDSCGDGPLVLLVHGNSASSLTFRNQLQGDFGEDHRVIAIDLPGHGDSDPFADPADYSIPGYAAIVAETAEALEMEEAVVVGWSLGGHIVLEAHDQLPEARGFMIYGTPPINFAGLLAGSGFLPHPAGSFGFIPTLDQAMAEQYATAFFSPGAAPDVSGFVDDILRTDPNARGGLFTSVLAADFEDEVAIVANLATPLAIVHGANEQLVDGPYIDSLTYSSLWEDEVHYVSGAGHAAHWEQADEFNDILEDFVDDVS